MKSEYIYNIYFRRNSFFTMYYLN